ncbi:putative Ig domain-containing protein, partial [Mesorhizobium sp. ESP-6-2]|uniref:putative Ig domain-containing protein n=1 Tax=Mesorhizobium sp. ESP-6-2 TaxID=2876625 RepID=UPI001CCFEB02
MPSTVTLASTPSAATQVGQSYSQTNVASGGMAPYTYSISAGSLPAGTSLNSATGTVSGTPTAAGSFNYTVQAVDSTTPAHLTASQTVSGTIAKGTQTISFTQPANAALTSGPVTLSATTSSGLMVAFTSTTTAVCTVSGNSVTLLSAGTCTIDADQAGNANYQAATTVSRSFAVTQGTQAISFAQPANAALTSGPVALSATASSGLTVAFTSTTTAVCTVSGNSVTLLSAGTCTIDADQAGNANYQAAATVSRSFSVTQGTQTISFTQPANAALTSGPVTLSATASSGLTVAFTSTTTAVCTVSG